MIVQSPQKLLRRVRGALFSHEFERVQRVLVPKLIPQGLWQIRHRVPLDNAMHIKPLQQLRHTIRRLPPGLKLRLQFLQRPRFDVWSQFGVLDLEFVWSLDVGIWSFPEA